MKAPQLFGAGPNSRLNAQIDRSGDRWILYLIAYERGVEVLAEQIRRTPSEAGLLFFPFTFLLRQWIELGLKTIIRDCSELLDGAVKVPGTHDIETLWKTARGLLERAFPDQNHAHLDHAEAVISQLHLADPSSFEFRYPEDKAGNPVGGRVPVFNVDQTLGTMRAARVIVNGAIDYIGETMKEKRHLEKQFDGVG